MLTCIDCRRPKTFSCTTGAAGTIDVTLLHFEKGIYLERASRGITGLGGIEIDQKLRELVTGSMKEYVEYEHEEKVAFELELERVKILLVSRRGSDPGGSVPDTGRGVTRSE